MASAIRTAFVQAFYDMTQGLQALFEPNGSRPDLIRDLLETEKHASAPTRARRPDGTLRDPGELRIVRSRGSSVRTILLAVPSPDLGPQLPR